MQLEHSTDFDCGSTYRAGPRARHSHAVHAQLHQEVQVWCVCNSRAQWDPGLCVKWLQALRKILLEKLADFFIYMHTLCHYTTVFCALLTSSLVIPKRFFSFPTPKEECCCCFRTLLLLTIRAFL